MHWELIGSGYWDQHIITPSVRPSSSSICVEIPRKKERKKEHDGTIYLFSNVIFFFLLSFPLWIVGRCLKSGPIVTVPVM